MIQRFSNQTPRYINELLTQLSDKQHIENFCILGTDEKELSENLKNKYRLKDSDIHIYTQNESEYPAELNTSKDYIRTPFLDNNKHLKKFDLVAGIIPFGSKLPKNIDLDRDEYDRFRGRLPHQTRCEYAYILQSIETINPDGKAVLACPTSILSRLGKEQDFRKNLINKKFLESVITLPNKCLSITTMSVSILIFNKIKTDRNVLLIDAENDFEKVGSKNELRPEDINKIITHYKQHQEKEGYSKIVSFEELEKNDFVLNVQLYIQQKKKNKPIDLKLLEKDVLNLEKSILKTKNEVKTNLEELEVIVAKNKQ